jgi:hypothetical protein
MKENDDVQYLGNVEHEVVVDDLAEGRDPHEIGGRLLVRRESEENEKRFPEKVGEDASDIGI